MKIALLFLVLSSFCFCTINAIDKCTCTLLKSQYDCELNTTCQWESSGCSDKKNDEEPKSTAPISQLCNSLKATECAITKGCAYYLKKCIHFSGCTSYSLKTHSDCQAVSNQCTTNGEQCILPRACSENDSEVLCTSVVSSSGSSKCVWSDQKCRDQLCSEAPTTYNSDTQCNTFISGCITTGQGCVDKLSNCFLYQNCDGMIGSDGVCEMRNNKCQPKDCGNAPLVYTTDQQCQSYRKGCRTLGIGCTEFSLKNCSTYIADDETCFKYIGKDGKCEGGSNGRCQVRKCESASKLMKTDLECQNYAPQCKTTGLGCVATLNNCFTYSGTKTDCEKRVGIDGKCTGVVDDEEKLCRARLCSDVIYSTTEECQKYQTTCISNGNECVYNLQPCAAYKGDKDKCKKYIGMNGKCTVGLNGFCALNNCENENFKTNDECKQVQSWCLTNGNNCINSNTCINTLQQITCNGTDNCQWNGFCVSNKCTSFYTQGLCKSHSSTIECFWDGNQCFDRKCEHASQDLKTNDDCNYFLKGCVTNGIGCISASAQCEDYEGFVDSCQNFKGNNGTIQCTYDFDNSKCRSIKCEDNLIAQSQDECQKYLAGCTFNGKRGCISPNSICGLYFGDAQTCYSLNKNCYQYNNVVNGCKQIQCSDNNSSTTNYDCELFLSGCVTRGIGCIENTALCTQYTGSSIPECMNYKGNGKQCWYDDNHKGICVDKICSLNTTAITDFECNQFLEGCVTNGSGCQDSSLNCETYNGDEIQCGLFYGNKQRCIKIAYCDDRQCADVKYPIQNDDCQNYLDGCIYDGEKCMPKNNCNNYYGYSQDRCSQLINLQNDYCWSSSDYSSCRNRICTEATDVSSQQDCTQFRSNCLYNGNNGCVEIQQTCNLYKNFTIESCQNAVDKLGNGCWQDGSGNCMDRTCNETLTNYSQQICQKHHSKCIFTGLKCAANQSQCEQYNLSQSECKYLNCWKEFDDDTTCVQKTCQDSISSPSDETCRNHLDTCRYNGSICVDALASCQLYLNFTVSACKETTTLTGEYCWYQSLSSSTCAQRTCNDVLPLYSSDNCISHLSTCRFNGLKCQDAKANCGDYTGFTREACQQVSTLTNKNCWYQGTSSICIDSTCEDYISNPSMENCIKHGATCRYNGVKCMVSQATCLLYVGFSNELCQQLTDTSNNQCTYDVSGNSNSCVTKACSNKQQVYNQQVCSQYIITNNQSSCVYDGIKCIQIQNSCNLYIGYSGVQCQVLYTSTNKSCYLESDVQSGTCRTRQCIDNQTAKTDLECDLFLSGCVTTGLGCVKNDQPCSLYVGTESSCSYFSGNGIKCRGADEIGTCKKRECYHNRELTSDHLCNDFLQGCVTNGMGCISSEEPCSSYTGTRAQCSNFTGNGLKCYSDSVDTASVCRNKTCKDNTTATTDKLCGEFLSGCVSKGFGCIEATVSCSDYFGNQAECRRYTGLNGTTPCWNVSDATSTTRCIVRECHHLARATNDTECNSFLSGCVSDGFKCITTQNCSSFYGTIRSCALFNAIDKPCKGVDNQIRQCQQLLCQDAPNNYDTDKKCNQFKSGCRTTGFGCTDQNSCESVQTKSQCQERQECQFINGCFNNIKLCMQITKFSLCVNNSNLKCGWDYATKKCREWQCTDASVKINSHQQCAQLNNTCTTNGYGCVVKTQCKKYTNKQTCVYAKSVGYTATCVWDVNFCRDFVCEDAPVTSATDLDCQKLSPLCVTSGKGCTYYQYKCENINLQEKCKYDAQQNPCIWVEPNCITFSQCSDIKGQTHEQCQIYSTDCTSNGDYCIPLQKCGQYTNYYSCKKGTDGTCGWVMGLEAQYQRCQNFKQCSDINGLTQENCSYYQSNCISDGVKCIDKNTCQNYNTQIACNYNGTDGYCFWDDDNQVCRLQICQDAPKISQMTHDYCYKFNVIGKCTTDGNQCIVMQNCSSYLENSCYYGNDGECVFALPLGQVSGTKSCRLKDCIDFIETKTDKCKQHRQDCVSNGTNCIRKANCEEYTKQVACESDGLNGICIYDQEKCSLLTSCEQANQNDVACLKKSAVCQLQVDTNDGVTTQQCIPITCSISENCQAVYDFSQKEMTICIQTKTACENGQGYQLAKEHCNTNSHNTFTWNNSTNACEQCIQPPIITPIGTDKGWIIVVPILIMMFL